jgi:hypothetical protein
MQVQSVVGELTEPGTYVSQGGEVRKVDLVLVKMAILLAPH